MLSYMKMHNTSFQSRSSTVAMLARYCSLLASMQSTRCTKIVSEGALTYGLLGGHRDNQRGDKVGHIVDATLAHPAGVQLLGSQSVNECMKLSMLGE